MLRGRLERLGGAREKSLGTAILGAGPAGLTAAHVLARLGERGTVFEADGVVGGLAKTVEFNGYRFDLGGHRFFTKLAPIERLWEEILGDEFLTRPRLSRIYYGGRYFYYPLEAGNVVRQLGLVESLRCAGSYFAGCLRPRRDETFEDWVTSRFGRRLYERFFRSYSEKVWGIPGSEIMAEWAAQRIKDFSFWHALAVVLHLRRPSATTLIEQFRYPRLGPGQMWDGFRSRVEEAGIPVLLNHRCVTLVHTDHRVARIAVRTNGSQIEHVVDGILSTLPLGELVLALDPPPPAEVIRAARHLRHRALCVVALILDQPESFKDNWVYIHDPGTRAARVQNFGAWSEDLVLPRTTCLGVEYFCFEGDDIWELPGEAAVSLARKELARIGLIDPADVVDGVKISVPKAYPIYDADYRKAVAVLRSYLESFENVKTFGRNGLHRYNNQDHSMWTAALATLNLVRGSHYDVWSVNTEAEYLEAGDAVEAVLAQEVVSALG
jgi:protoporphyrinogen oxidase